MTPEGRFADLADELADEPGVTRPEPGSRFGASALKVNGSIVAMLMDDALVVKLPAARVAELINSGAGEPFGAGKGRPMREWVALGADADWSAIAREALAFVRG